MILLEDSRDSQLGSQEQLKGSQGQLKGNLEQLKDSRELHQEQDNQGIHRQQELEQERNLGSQQELRDKRILLGLELKDKEHNLLVRVQERMDKEHILQEQEQVLAQGLEKELIQELLQNELQGKSCQIPFLYT